MLDSQEEVRLSFAGPGEIKRREVSWTLKKLDCHLRVQARSGETWCGAGPSREPRRDQEQGGGAGLRKLDLSFASVVSQQQCSAQQLKQQLQSTLVASQWRGLHSLNIVVVLAVVHGLLGLLRV